MNFNRNDCIISNLKPKPNHNLKLKNLALTLTLSSNSKPNHDPQFKPKLT